MREEFDRLVRVVRLRQELKPVEIYMGDPPKPVNPDWVGVVHRRWKHDRRADLLESFDLTFRTDDGHEVTCCQFETLAIVLDQASATVGVNQSEWHTVELDLPDDATT